MDVDDSARTNCRHVLALHEAIMVADAAIEETALGGRTAHRRDDAFGNVEIRIEPPADEADIEPVLDGIVVERAYHAGRHDLSTHCPRFAFHEGKGARARSHRRYAVCLARQNRATLFK